LLKSEKTLKNLKLILERWLNVVGRLLATVGDDPGALANFF